jgi:hypothetical protein
VPVVSSVSGQAEERTRSFPWSFRHGSLGSTQRHQSDDASNLTCQDGILRDSVDGRRFHIRRVRADDPAELGAPLSYAVEVLAGDDDDQDLEPAAAALSKSRQWGMA